MNSLLHHVDLITRSVNRGKIEASVIRAINEILGAERTELHKIFMPPGDVLVGLAAEIGAGGQAGVIIHDDGFSWPEQFNSIESAPHFQACLSADLPYQEAIGEGRFRAIALVKNEQHTPFAFLLIQHARPLSAADLEIVEGFASLLRNCLTMLDYSETDSLTRLLNRKTFDEYLIRILTNIPRQDDDGFGALHLPHRRHEHPEAHDHWLAVMDIDKFKSINDRFGHLIGDEVLILLASLMRESFRLQDKLFRFGGEEFIALLRPAEYQHAQAIFERFRLKVESFPFPQVGQVTISIGYARINIGDTPSIILDSADEALYWAKAHGRNQCHSYEALVEAGKIARHQALSSDFEIF